MVIKVGVLELQGDFALHHRVFKGLGIDSASVKVSADLVGIDGLVIPGGESTTMSLLIDSYGMHEPLVDFGKSNPVMGTCAGLILMAKTVHDKRIKSLEFLDIVVDRNAYGRQIESAIEVVQYTFNDDYKLELSTTLIRAPKISELGDNLHVIGKFNGSPVAVLSGHHLGLSFHPELDGIDIFHKILFDPDSQVYYKKINQAYAA